ncbi:MAG: DNA/RNA nuclease SfsA [Bdellovibrio sp.]|jgi:sugar fermentation stimulation protein A
MKWVADPVEVIFLKRYKRFFADVKIKNKIEVAHVANTGNLKPNLQEGVKALVLPSTNPERKLKWTLMALQAPSGSWVGIDTSIPNKLLADVFASGQCKEWTVFSDFKPEIKISKETRLDGLLSSRAKKRYIEVKNTTYAVGDFENKKGQAQFPDSVTERGQKHLRELMTLMEQDHECELIFAVQRMDCTSFAPADDIDPEYGRLLRQAIAKGLIVSPWVIEVSNNGVKWTGKKLPVEIGD